MRPLTRKASFTLFCSPSVSNEEKKSVIRQVFAKQIEPELLDFLMTLIDKKGESLLKEAVRIIVSYLTRGQGVATGILYSVTPLSEERVKAFEEKLEKHIGKKVRLLNRIDTSLVGGIRIFIEGQLIDASIRKRLTDLAERIKQRTREEESVEEEKKDAIESAIEEEIKQHQNELAYTYYGTVTQVGDGIAKIFGLDNCMAGELLEFPNQVYGMASIWKPTA